MGKGMYKDSTERVLLMAGELGGILCVQVGFLYVREQWPVGIYWSSLCWQGRNEGTGGATHAVEWLHTYCALWNSVGARAGDGHTGGVVPGGISAEVPVQGGSQSQHAQVIRESLPIVRATSAHGRGDGMALWNTCMPTLCVDVFSVSFSRQSPACVTGSVNNLLQSVNSQSSTRVAAG